MQRHRHRSENTFPSFRRSSLTGLMSAAGLWALCHGRGLLAGETTTATELGLTPRRWSEFVNAGPKGNGALPRSEEIDAAGRWAFGTDLGDVTGSGARNHIRAQRKQAMRKLLRSAWPKRPQQQCQALAWTESWASRPEQLRASERDVIRDVWANRACMVFFECDVVMLPKLLANPGLADTVADALGIDERDPDTIVSHLAEERMHRPSLLALEFATAQALRTGTEREQIAMIWLAANASEKLGKPQRAMRLYAQIERFEHDNHYESKVMGEPRPGDAHARRVRLMWLTGDPDTMQAALDDGLAQPEPAAFGWLMHNRRNWAKGKGTEQIALIRERTEAVRLARANSDPKVRDRARLELAETYLAGDLNARAIAEAWGDADDPAIETALATTAAHALTATRAHPAKIRTQWDRAFAATPTDPVATLGIAETEAEQDLSRSAGLWAIRAIWHNRRHRTLTPEDRSKAAELMTEAGHTATAARTDRALLREHRILALRTAVAITARMLERNEYGWWTAMNRALDAIAIERFGIATLGVTISSTLRSRDEHPELDHKTPRTARAEQLRIAVHEHLAAPARYTPQPPAATQTAIRNTIRNEPRELRTLLARLPLPVAETIRALRAAHALADADERGALVTETELRLAAVFEHWALHAPRTGHRADDFARKHIERMRTRLHVRPENEHEWRTIH